MTALDELNRIKSVIDSLKYQRVPDDFEYGSIVVKKCKNSVWVLIEIDFKVDRRSLLGILSLIMDSGIDGKVSFESIGKEQPLVRVEISINSDCLLNSNVKPVLEELNKMILPNPILVKRH